MPQAKIGAIGESRLKAYDVKEGKGNEHQRFCELLGNYTL